MEKSTKNKKKKVDKEKLFIRIVAGIMGGLMLFGAAAMVLQLI